MGLLLGVGTVILLGYFVARNHHRLRSFGLGAMAATAAPDVGDFGGDDGGGDSDGGSGGDDGSPD
jgi:hypothetical protein